jgi:replicative DNA helicase
MKFKYLDLTDMELEKAFLGCCAKRPDLIFDVEGIIRPEDLTEANSVIFGIMHTLVVDKEYKKIDSVSIINYAKEAKLRDSIGETKYVSEICSSDVEPSNCMKYAVKIKQLSAKRILKEKLEGAAATILNDETTVLSTLGNVEKEIFDFTSIISSENKIKKLGAGALELITKLANEKRETIGLPTSFKLLDKAVGGLFRRPSVNVFASRSKGGKSFAAMNLCHDQAKRNVPVLLLDSELSEEDQQIRLVSLESAVPSYQLETGRWCGEVAYKDMAIDSAKALAELPLYRVGISGEPIDAALSYIRQFLNRIVGRRPDGQYNDCVIFYDYLKITDVKDITKSVEEHQAIGFMMQKLRNLALRYNVSINVMVQSNRAGLKNFDEGSVALSDRLSWLCTSLSMLVKKSPEEISQYGAQLGHRKMYVILSHHGEGLEPGDFIHLKDDLRRAKIEEIKLESEVQQNVKKMIDEKENSRAKNKQRAKSVNEQSTKEFIDEDLANRSLGSIVEEAEER